MPVKRLSGGEMPEHDELVNEIALIEKMSTAERLKHAKKRRQVQLKRFAQYEKALDKEQNKKNKKSQQNKRLKRSDKARHVCFVNNVMLLEAAARNDIQEVKSLLSQGVDPDVTNEDGLTALHQCCIDDLEEMLRVLLDQGASVNAQDSEMWTPLHAAATCGHIHLCKILIEQGAELLSVNADGNMPYDICEDEITLDFIENEMAKRGVTQEQIDETRLSTEVKMLLDLQKMAKNNDGLEFRGRVMETPLHIAAANGYIQVTEFLMNNHVSVNVEDGDSWQPIHAAACWGHLPVLEILVQHGADLDAKTKNGETPYDICEDIEMRERLMELKSEIAAKGQVKSRNLVRRRSTNTRSSVVSSSGSIYSSNTSLSNDKHHHSASVRRVSSKEKGAISFKEAVEEGRRLRESVSDNEDEEDPDQNKQNGAKQEPPRQVEDVQVFMPVEDPSPKSSPRGPPQQSNSWGEVAIPPPAAFTKPDTPPTKKQPEKPSRSSHQQVKQDVVVTQPKPQPTTRPSTSESKTGSPKVTKEQQQKDSNNKQPAGKKGPAPSPLVSGSTDSIDSMKRSKKTAPKPPQPAEQHSKPDNKQPQNIPAKQQHNKPQASSSSESHHKENKQPPAPQRSTRNDEQTATGGVKNRDTVDHQNVSPPPSSQSHHQQQDDFVTPEHKSAAQQQHYGQGTLSDLKKQRAQRLQERLHQDSMRFKDGDKANTEIRNFNNDSYSPENEPQPPTNTNNRTSNNPTQQYTNGQNGKAQPPNNNSYYVHAGSGDTVKKYKFSDTTSVVGDTDTQTSCCVVQ